MGVKLKRVGTVRVEFHGTPVLTFGGAPIPVVPEHDVTEVGMRFGERVVDLDGPQRRRPRLRHELGRRHFTAYRAPAVRVRESRVGEGVVRVYSNRLLEVSDARFG